MGAEGTPELAWTGQRARAGGVSPSAGNPHRKRPHETVAYRGHRACPAFCPSLQEDSGVPAGFLGGACLPRCVVSRALCPGLAPQSLSHSGQVSPGTADGDKTRRLPGQLRQDSGHRPLAISAPWSQGHPHGTLLQIHPKPWSRELGRGGAPRGTERARTAGLPSL